MQLEKDQTALVPESTDDTRDRDTEWLLDRDLSDQEDSLFTVDEDHVEIPLTPFEAEMAARPMFRGHGEGDDLSSMVDEEIVMSEVGSESDIYTTVDSLKNVAAAPEVPLTVDHTNAGNAKNSPPSAIIADGEDILSLSDEDDMGDHHFVLIKAQAEAAAAAINEPVLTMDAAEESPAELTLEPMETNSADEPGIDQDAEFKLELEHDLKFGSTLSTESSDNLDAILDLTESPEMIDGLVEEFELGSDLEFESALDLESELDLSSDFDIESELDLDVESGSDLDLESELDLKVEPESDLVLESKLDLEVEPESDLDLESELDLEVESEADLDLESELDLEVESESDLDLESELDLKVEPESDLDLESELDLEVESEADLDLESELDLEVESESDLNLESELDLEAESESDFDLESELDLEVESEADLDLESELDLEVESESDLNLESELDSEVEAEASLASNPVIEEVAAPNVMEDGIPEMEVSQEVEETPQAEIESVLDYIASTPAPTDETEFDEYLLRGQKLESSDTDSESLTVVRTEGIASVDPVVDSAIDYHEDFRMIEGFNENTVSAITGVIAQVMEEVTEAVETRLADLAIDSENVLVEAMVGNDVESIIECVTDGYAPIVDVRPELPAVLRQLGQSEVDAIYVRISHSEIPGNWNDLFTDDFVAPQLQGANDSIEAEEDASPQPFAEFDLDEFDFTESQLGQDADLTIDGFDEELTSFTELSSDDPLASIDFATISDEEKYEEFQPEYLPAPVVREVHGDSIAKSEELSDDALAEFSETSWCVPAGLRFSTSDSGGSELFEEFLDVFMEEATSELEKIEDAIGSWEALTTGTTVVPVPVSHSLHTLKGIAKGVGLHRYGTLIHNYETLLDGLHSSAGEGARVAYFKIVNAWLDAVVHGFESIEKSRQDISEVLPTAEGTQLGSTKSEHDESATIKASEETKMQPTKVEVSADRVVPVSNKIVNAPAAKPAYIAQTDKQLADEGAQTLAAQQTVRMTSEALDNLLTLTNQAQQLGVRSSENTVRSKLAAAESLASLSAVRSHIVKIADRALGNVSAKGKRTGSELDALEMDQYSELQEAANILRESVEDLEDLIRVSSRQISLAEALMKQQSSVISSLGSSLQAVRVVPVSRLFPGLRRIVRNVGTDLGKTAVFKVLNQVGTLDRDNHARCQVILEHMVRNAMDHGIESPEQREAAGKSASGTITIDVNKKGADYIITLSDDGKGVDPDLMRETAYQRGLDIDVDALSDDEAIRLIFHKGFSTATSLSEISGRGVGMDIVLSELQKIGGDVEIESIVGRGTSFHIRIPPNVSVNGALLVSAGERSYAIPLDGLIAVDYVNVDDFFDAVSGQTKLSLFGVECDPAYLPTLCHGENLPERASWAGSIPVLIAGSEDRYMAIAVDDVKQALELVIRSLGVQFSSVPGVSGATTTADGQAVVALDLNALVGSVGSADIFAMTTVEEEADELLVLVVDDSRTQRMVSISQFDTLGVETITAENGMVAIDLLNTIHRLPHVILLDVEMPVKDGIQTLREIRKSKRYSHIPVIMVTSRTGSKHRALADEAGCDGYMGKPFNFPVLVEQISQLTGRKLETS